MKKSNQKSLGEDPETPYASVRPDRKVCDLPDLGLDDAYKVSATHFYRPALERGRANHHPCPLL